MDESRFTAEERRTPRLRRAGIEGPVKPLRLFCAPCAFAVNGRCLLSLLETIDPT